MPGHARVAMLNDEPLLEDDLDGFGDEDAREGPPLDDEGFLDLIGRAEAISRDYQLKTVQKPLATAYRAWHNQHDEGSKYLGPQFKGRSRLFVPKTRAAVRKNLATAAASLFSTEEVVNVSAQLEDDPQQRATAAMLKADLDYRLTRASTRSGMPWYLISMGGCLDAQLTGITVSKQLWEYEEVDTGKVEVTEQVFLDPLTGTVLEDETGAPIKEVTRRPIKRVTKDRPFVEIHPIENVGVDPAAPWHSPVQGGRWWYVDHPMGLSDARSMIRSQAKNGRPSGWLDVDDATLLKGRMSQEMTGSRRVREGGGDRWEDAKSSGQLDIVWLRENFIRIDGVDWHFWTVGRHAIISEIRRTEDAYPANGGERPYVMGNAQLDTHRVFPQSPVQTWQPLQLEINDVANLRLDTLKRSIAPLTLVKRGKNVDLAALQRRGQPEATIMVDAPEDVSFASTPGPNGTAFTEQSVSNALFDELSGTFSTSSVQSSRQLNETVGGMRLMSGAANAVSEFDLRMWIETWVEPVLRQVAHLIRYYESDERVMAIAGQQARVWQRFQMMPSIDDFEQTEIILRVNAGIGALDPMAKLQKLEMAMKVLGPMMQGAQSQGIAVDIEAVIEEVMGAAGFRDGRRFFKFGQPPPQEAPDPKAMAAMEKLQIERDQLQADMQQALAKIDADKAIAKANNDTKLAIERMRHQVGMARHAIDLGARRQEMQQNRQASVDDRNFAAAGRERDARRNAGQSLMRMLAGRAA